MDVGLRNARNQRTGGAFEAALSWEAVRAEVLAVRNGQTVRWLPGGRSVAVKSNLDWTLVKKARPTAFCDTKSFQARRFGRSMLDPHQVALAHRYRQFGAIAGFIVHLRELNAVVFYSADVIVGTQLRQGFGIDDGKLLGRLQAFDVAKVWDS